MSDDTPESQAHELPWTIEQDLLKLAKQEFQNPLEELVIARYLMAGDTRPLAWFLLHDHRPSPHLLKYIANMLQPGSAPVEKVPFELVGKSRTKGRGRPPKGPEQKLRDFLIYFQVSDLMERNGPGSYDAAIAEVSAYDGLERATVKRAYESIKLIMDRAPESE